MVTNPSVRHGLGYDGKMYIKQKVLLENSIHCSRYTMSTSLIPKLTTAPGTGVPIVCPFGNAIGGVEGQRDVS